MLLIRPDLPDDAKVLRLAGLLGADVDLVVGKLVRLWTAVTRHSQDGHLPLHAAADVDDLARLPGFAAALAEVGWLELTLLGAQVLGWEQYLGTEGVRALMQAWLDAHPKPRGGASTPSDPGFADFWSEYPRKAARKEALKAWRRLRPTEAQRQRIMAALREDKRGEQWRKDGGQFVPYPATWLNGERWTDERAPARPVEPGRVQAPAGKYDHLSAPEAAQPAPEVLAAQQGADRPGDQSAAAGAGPPALPG